LWQQGFVAKEKSDPDRDRSLVLAFLQTFLSQAFPET
jgi:hypothetical protein